MTLAIDSLNHASVLISDGDFSLLSDPWFGGTAFSGGWGLQYENPEALTLASRATHLWISHWHSDHLHAPTLEALAAQNPKLCVLANVSANFSMLERLRQFGFRNLIPLPERRALTLASGVEVERFPTAGIDNALLLRTGRFSVLNYNDCNLPAGAIGALKRRIGHIDVLLANYNHAGKLFETRPPDEEKDVQWSRLKRVVQLFQPRLAIPFASSHYYRAEVSREQNQSLLSYEDVERRAAGSKRLCVLRIGDRIELASTAAEPEFTRRSPPLALAPQSVLDYGASVPWPRLLEAASTRCHALHHAFPVLSRFTGTLVIDVSDHGRRLRLDAKTGQATSAGISEPVHIAAHSAALFDWLGRPFGADTFAAGAHFAIVSFDTRSIQRWALLTLLEASHMSERDALGYISSREGLWFLWCRREEIMATLRAGQVKAGQTRLA